MKKMNTATKVLALVGTVLVWFPLIAPFVIYLARPNRAVRVFDWLIPAELFPLVLLGGLLLLWAALRAKSQRRTIAWALGIAVAILFVGQGLAVVTGLADGRIPPEGWPFLVVTGTVIIYILALVGMGVGGILLVRRLYHPA